MVQELYVKLLNDKNKWVKLQAYKNLGPLIHELQEIEQISKSIIQSFFKMNTSALNNLYTDDEVAFPKFLIADADSVRLQLPRRALHPRSQLLGVPAQTLLRPHQAPKQGQSVS